MYDRLIQKIIKKWKKEAGATRVVQWTYKDGILTLYTGQPGFMIGKAGKLYDKYYSILRRKLYGLTELKFVETDWFWA